MTDTRETGSRAPTDAAATARPASTESGSLSEVLARVAAATRSVVHVDRIALALLAGANTVESFATVEDGAFAQPGYLRSRQDCSDRFWPQAGAAIIWTRDTATELETTHPFDGALLDGGFRSVIALSLDAEQKQFGVLWFGVREPGLLDDHHVHALQPVASLLALALEHEHRHRLELDRRHKRDQLQRLLPMLAEALDVRSVYPRMSTLLQAVLPHVTTTVALLTPDGGGVRIHASNQPLEELPEYRFSSAQETISANWQSFVGYDAEFGEHAHRVRITPLDAEPAFVELRPGPGFAQLASRFNTRSLIRVPLRIKDKPIGAIAFGSDRPGCYDADDVELATRIADHVSLALAHEQLVEEERRAARALERVVLLQARVDTLVQELEQQRVHRALGESPAWKDALVQATRVADTAATVLITGESGTGKEVIARFIHRASPRARGPFVAMNCAALPEQLLESELFGFERGAFTGAHVSRAGKIEQAAGGVLFLDEVAEMSTTVQAKFLRVLQEREFQRLGGARTLKADIRVIAATNRDPKLAIERGTLREDLYYRLGVFEITLPPLRERGSDILMLADAFVDEVCRSMGRPAAGISEEARDLLVSYAWPGNVRELRNAIERAVIMCGGSLVTGEHLPIAIGRHARLAAASTATATTTNPSLGDLPAGGIDLDAIERDLVQKALARARNNKSQAAKLLGLPRGQFYSLLRRYGLTDARR